MQLRQLKRGPGGRAERCGARQCKVYRHNHRDGGRRHGSSAIVRCDWFYATAQTVASNYVNLEIFASNIVSFSGATLGQHADAQQQPMRRCIPVAEHQCERRPPRCAPHGLCLALTLTLMLTLILLCTTTSTFNLTYPHPHNHPSPQAPLGRDGLPRRRRHGMQCTSRSR